MEFNLSTSLKILERTPDVLRALLQGLPVKWTASNEGAATWSAFDVLGHLIDAEKKDWVPRIKILLFNQDQRRFAPFERRFRFSENDGKSLDQLLIEFKEVRLQNVAFLRGLQLTSTDLTCQALHPAFGDVNLSQLLSTWVVHDLNHMGQITRVMAKQYKTAVGPWIEYLRILQR
jgi:uncharacterized damage-inducible protein DinB